MTPLDPSGDQARSLLRHELAKPEYVRSGIVERILRWLDRTVGHATESAGHVSLLTTLATIVVVLAVVVGILLVASRARRTTRAAAADRAVLTDSSTTAAELRSRAEAHLAAGRHDEALVDAYRALARRQIERGVIDDIPQATAHELARAITAAVTGPAATHVGEVAGAADLFDAVMYGDHPASRDQAARVLALDDVLAGRRAALR